jgi:hypothetical protein
LRFGGRGGNSFKVCLHEQWFLCRAMYIAQPN